MSFRIRSLQFAYDGQKLFDDLSLEIPQGVIAILGPSGSGKTTLLNLLGLLLDVPLAEGNITRPGTNVDYSRLTAAQRDRLRGHSFGFVLQSCYLLPYLTCLENVALPLEIQGVPRHIALKRAEAMIVATGDVTLIDALNRWPNQISQGQKQRFAVLRAVVHGPEVVFADEPTSNLDAVNTAAMIGLLKSWRDSSSKETSRTLVVVCHNLSTARNIADHVIVLVHGRLHSHFQRNAWEQFKDDLEPILGVGDPLPSNEGKGVQFPEPEPLHPRAPRKTFLARLAFRDLFDRRFIFTGWLVFFSVALVTGLAFVTLAWPAVAEQNRIAQLNRKPLSNLVFIGPKFDDLAHRFFPEDITSIETDLREVLGARFVAMIPCHEKSIVFQIGVTEPAKFAATYPLRGRTVSGPNDPQLKAHVLKSGRTLETEDDSGIVVCPRFLKTLGLSENIPLPFKRSNFKGGDPFSIVGIYADNFPQGVSFFMTERYAASREKQEAFNNLILNKVRTLYLPEPWVKLIGPDGELILPEDVKQWLDPSLAVVVESENQRFKIGFKKTDTSIAAWKSFLAEFVKMMRQHEPKLPELRLDLKDEKSDEPTRIWDYLTLQVNDVPALPDAVATISNRGFTVNETVTGQLQAYADASEEARRVNSRILWVVNTAVGLLLFVIQTMRMAQKGTEIGLLRSAGMRRGHLDVIFLIQAAGIGICSLFLGGAFSLLFIWSQTNSDQFGRVTDSEWRLNSSLIGTSILAILFATAWVACRKVSSGSPAERLSGS